MVLAVLHDVNKGWTVTSCVFRNRRGGDGHEAVGEARRYGVALGASIRPTSPPVLIFSPPILTLIKLETLKL
jgi:hypothetical protein